VRRVALLATAALAAAALSGAAAAADSGVRVVEAKGPPFPVRTFVVSLPTGRGLTIHGIHVTENGNAVAEPTLIPASQASPKAFGVVLVSDTSFSMAGKPLAAALAAENAFVAQRNQNEQVGVIDFNRKATTQQRLTTSSSAISKALSSTPTLSGGTHIYDAVHQAESMLSQGHVNSGSIVVLSDGADTGSKKTIDEVAQTALRKNIRIYTIGLDDAQFNPGTLKALADAGHGEYAQAKAGKLAPLFDKLGQTLSNEYLLQYKSLTKLNDDPQPVDVSVSVKGVGSDTAAYQTPVLQVSHQTAPPFRQSIGNRIWGSTLTLLLVALLAIGAIGLLAYAVFQPRRSNLPARMAEFVSIRELQRDKAPGGPTPAANATATATAAATAGGTVTPVPKTPMERFKEVLEIAEIDVEPELIILGTVVGTVLAFVMILAITGSLIWAVFALLIPYFVREWVLRTLKRRRDKFAEQLPDALQVIASAMRTGHSFAGALAVVVDSGSEPMKSELRRVVADEQLGVPMEKSLSIVAERMASSDVEQLALVSELQREAGGNSAEVIDRVAETVRERFDLRRMIQTLTTQGRLSRWIVSLLPVFIIIIFELENPHYLHPLIASTGGKVVLALAAGWAALGSYVIKKIVEIEV
jgi:tight adherence protein B